MINCLGEGVCCVWVRGFVSVIGGCGVNENGIFIELDWIGLAAVGEGVPRAGDGETLRDSCAGERDVLRLPFGTGVPLPPMPLAGLPFSIGITIRSCFLLVGLALLLLLRRVVVFCILVVPVWPVGGWFLEAIRVLRGIKLWFGVTTD